MYVIKDKRSAIREVQRYLLTVSQSEKTIPHITLDGFFDEETSLAVKEFQKIHALPITGTVDKNTFDLLFAESERIIEQSESNKLVYSNGNFPLSIGSSGESVSILHSILAQLSEYYEFPSKPQGDYYSIATSEVINELRKIFALEESESTDQAFIIRMQEDLIAREKFKFSN